MIDVLNGRISAIGQPFSLWIYGVNDKLFDELVDEDTPAELFDGVMIVHSPASPRHNRLAGFLGKLLSLYAEARDLGEVFGPDDLIRLAPGRKFAPDVFFLRSDRLPDPLPEAEFTVAPDLVIEVLSPSTRDYDLNKKRAAYHKAGVRELWFVDAASEQVILDRRGKRRYTSAVLTEGRLTTKAVPGFWLEVSWLWGKRLPKTQACLRKILD
jgi:Uma2 family endonuclease